jgi:radical SAM protein with 4Fe4S-binding SPASM domain
MKQKNVTVISNGTAGTEVQYRQLTGFGSVLFEFPLHSSKPEPHDNMTRIKGSWEKSLNSIKRVLKLGGDVVPVIILTKLNADNLENTIILLKDLGITRIMLNRFNIGGEGIKEYKNLFLTQTVLKMAFSKANNLASRYSLKISSNVCTPVCYINPSDFPSIRFSHCGLKINRMPVTMDIEGNLRICNHSPVIMGNIFKDKLENIFESEYTKKWENTVPDICSGCKEYYRCFGGCRAASEQMGLSLEQADPMIREGGIKQ